MHCTDSSVGMNNGIMDSTALYCICCHCVQEAFQSTSVAFILDYPHTVSSCEDQTPQKGEGESKKGEVEEENEEGRVEGESEEGKVKGESEEGRVEGESEEGRVEGENEEGKGENREEKEEEGKKEKPGDEGESKGGEDESGTATLATGAPTAPAQAQAASSDSGQQSPEELAHAASLYLKYGATLDFCAQKEVRVIVAGCYANTGAAILARSAPSLPSTQIIAAPSLAERQARSIIGTRLGLNTADIQQVCVWGRTCGHVLVDASSAVVRHFQGAITGPNPFSLPIQRCEFEREWLERELQLEVERRHRGGRGAARLSEAMGVAELMRLWWRGGERKEEEEEERSVVDLTSCELPDCSSLHCSPSPWQPVGVVSDGDCYGFPKGVVCSVPARCVEGEWKVVKGIQLSEEMEVATQHYTTTL